MKILTLFNFNPEKKDYNYDFIGEKWVDLLKIDKSRFIHFESNPNRIFFAKKLYVPGTPRSKNPSPATLIASRRIVFGRLGSLFEKLSGIFYFFFY